MVGQEMPRAGKNDRGSAVGTTNEARWVSSETCDRKQENLGRPKPAQRCH